MRILIGRGAGPLAAYQAMHEERLRRGRLTPVEGKCKSDPPPTTTADDQLYTMGQDPRWLLRGIPAIGRGVTGAIRHTRPEDCLG